MTVPEAIAALAAAPMDDGISAVDPTRSRRRFTQEVRSIVDQHGMAIALSPSTAKMVAQAVQDTKFPVPMRFMYDKEGKLQVGWNKEEVEIRNAAVNGEHYHKPKEKVVFDFEEKRQAMLEQQRRIYEQLIREQALGAAGAGNAYYGTSLEQYLAKERAAINAQYSQEKAEALQRLLAVPFAAPAPKAEPKPAPEPEPPKPDPTSPKFVLKRPKPV